MRNVAAAALLLAVITACANSADPMPSTDTPEATSSPSQATGLAQLSEIWQAAGTGSLRYFTNPSTLARGRASKAILTVGCHKDLRVTEVSIFFQIPGWGDLMSTAQARRDARDRATALALLDRVFGVEDVYISVRNVGEAGRWMKSGWQHRFIDTGQLRLWQTPAEAFIHQLTEVEELAVLVTDDEGGNTSAVFDVRYLSTALASDDAGWEC